MNDMNEITIRINRWLERHDIEGEGVRIILEFPSAEGAGRANHAIMSEITPMMAFYPTGDNFGHIEKMNGLGLTLRVKDRKS